MSYLDDLKGVNPTTKKETKKETDDMIFTDAVTLRLYEPKEFVYNGKKRFRIETKVLSGEHEGKYYTIFVSPKNRKGSLNYTFKLLVNAILPEEVAIAIGAAEKDGVTDVTTLDNLVITTFLANIDKIKTATITATFSEPKEYTKKDGTKGTGQFLNEIKEVKFYTPRAKKEQEW
jgi:hypothetical protein